MFLTDSQGHQIVMNLQLLRSDYAPDHGNIPGAYDHPQVIIQYVSGDLTRTFSSASTSSLLDHWIDTSVSMNSATGQVRVDMDGNGTVDLSLTDAGLVGASLDRIQFDALGPGPIDLYFAA